METSLYEHSSKNPSSRLRRSPGSPAAPVLTKSNTSNPQLSRRLPHNALDRASAAVEQYIGPGISITDDTTKYTSGRSTDAHNQLHIENAQLREEVHHLKGLLATIGTDQDDDNPKAHDKRAWMKLTAHCAQLQRQVAVMDAELRARASTVQEAEASLEETAEQLGCLHGQDVITGSQLKAVQNWATAMVHRLQKSKAEAAKRATRQGLAHQYGSDAISSGVDRGQGSWELPYIPAGGNPFLAQPAAGRSQAPTVSGLVLGQHAGMLDSAAVMRLEQQLCGLGPRLEGLSVLLQTTLQPCIEWMSPFIQDYCKDDLGALARQVSQASTSLVELACLSSLQKSSSANSLQQRPRQPTSFVHSDVDEVGKSSGGALQYHHLASRLKEVIDELSTHVSSLPRERRSSAKSSIAVLTELVDRWTTFSVCDAGLYASLSKEVIWVKTVVSEQSQAVAALLQHVALAQHNLEGTASDPSDTKSAYHVASALKKVDQARQILEHRPSEQSLKHLVETLKTYPSCLAAAAELLITGPSMVQQDQLRAELSHLLRAYEEGIVAMHGRPSPSGWADQSNTSPPGRQPSGNQGPGRGSAGRKKTLHQREWVD